MAEERLLIQPKVVYCRSRGDTVEVKIELFGKGRIFELSKTKENHPEPALSGWICDEAKWDEKPEEGKHWEVNVLLLRYGPDQHCIEGWVHPVPYDNKMSTDGRHFDSKVVAT